jgi:predicted DNA-binding protein (UPF0278 family)
MCLSLPCFRNKTQRKEKAMNKSEIIDEIYQGLKKPGRHGSLKAIAERLGNTTRQNVSAVLRGKSHNEAIVVEAAKYLCELEEKSAQAKNEVSELVKRVRKLYLQTAELNGEY